MKMIRVLIADDRDSVRSAYAALLGAQPHMDVVGEASDGHEAVGLARLTRPDVVLMDIRMPRMSGLEATRLICSDPDLHRTRVLVLTTFDLDEYVYEALRAGASGFLLKDARPRDLLNGIEVVNAGEAMIAPKITRRLISEFVSKSRPPEPRPALLQLTEREREILVLVARGLSNAEIATRLHIAPMTAKTHVRNILHKLDSRDRTALTALAYESGLITPGADG